MRRLLAQPSVALFVKFYTPFLQGAKFGAWEALPDEVYFDWVTAHLCYEFGYTPGLCASLPIDTRNMLLAYLAVRSELE